METTELQEDGTDALTQKFNAAKQNIAKELGLPIRIVDYAIRD